MKKIILNTFLVVSAFGAIASLASCDKTGELVIPENSQNIQVESNGVKSLAKEIERAFNEFHVESISIEFKSQKSGDIILKADELLEVNDLYIKYKRETGIKTGVNKEGDVIYNSEYVIKLIFMDDISQISYDYKAAHEKTYVETKRKQALNDFMDCKTLIVNFYYDYLPEIKTAINEGTDKESGIVDFEIATQKINKIIGCSIKDMIEKIREIEHKIHIDSFWFAKEDAGVNQNINNYINALESALSLIKEFYISNQGYYLRSLDEYNNFLGSVKTNLKEALDKIIEFEKEL